MNRKIESNCIDLNVYILLVVFFFCREDIKKSLEQTEDGEFVTNQYDVDVNALNRSQILNLCVLILQKAHDYTGNGCWPDSELLDQDNIPDKNQLLAILNKYKGKKGKF